MQDKEAHGSFTANLLEHELSQWRASGAIHSL